MNNLLLVLDLQKSFINDNTKDLPKKIEQLIKLGQYDHVVFTRFINSENSIWYQRLNYRGCLSEEDKEIIINTENYTVMDKKIYTAFNNQLIHYIMNNHIDKIYLCGLETECCVLKTALDLFENEYEVYVLEKYCACTHGKERHDNAIKILSTTIGRNSIIM